MSHDFTSAPYSPAPSSFSVSSMADPNVQQRQPPVNGSYPSPHSYPSPSMQASYTYPPPQGSDAYRGSPQGAHNALPPLNLPPIRQLDGQPPQPQPQPQQQQQHHQQQAQQPMGSPLPPPHNGQPQYYPHQGHAPPGQMGMANMGPAQYNASMRYQLPPQHDQRQLSGGRHKKEIKRRTKTGCLTCRKRRIKVRHLSSAVHLRALCDCTEGAQRVRALLRFLRWSSAIGVDATRLVLACFAWARLWTLKPTLAPLHMR
jgi:hypothetical protein